MNIPVLSSLFIFKSLLSVVMRFSSDFCEDTKPVLNHDCTGQITDIKSNVYKTVCIGSQIRMQENLRTTIFNDTSPVTFVLKDSIWTSLKSPCYY